MRQPTGGRKAGSDGTRNTNTHEHTQDDKANKQTKKAKQRELQATQHSKANEGRAQHNRTKRNKNKNTGRRQRLHRDLVGAGFGDEKRLVIFNIWQTKGQRRSLVTLRCCPQAQVGTREANLYQLPYDGLEGSWGNTRSTRS